MGKLLRVLFIADSEEDMSSIAQLLVGEGYALMRKHVSTLKEVEDVLGDQELDVVISNYFLLKINSFDLLKIISTKNPFLPVIFVSGKIDEDVASEAIRAGAEDFIFKDNLKRIVSVVERGMQRSKDQQKRIEVTKIKEEKTSKKPLVNAKNRIFVNYLIAFFAVLLVFGFAYLKEIKKTEGQCFKEAQDIAVLVGSQLSVLLHEPTEPMRQKTSLLQPYIKKLSIPDEYNITIVDSNKRILAAKNPKRVGLIFNSDKEDEVQRTINDSSTRAFIGTNDINGKEARHIVASIKSDKKDVFGALILEYDSLHKEISSSGPKNLFEAFVLSFFAITFAFGLEVLNTRTILSPMVKLKEKIDPMKKGNFETPINNISACDEVKGLAESLEKTRIKINEFRQSRDSEVFESKQTEGDAQRTNTMLSKRINRMNRQRKEIELLNNMSTYLQSCTTKDEAFKVIHRHLEQLLSMENGAMYLYDSSHKILESVVVWGTFFSDKKIVYPDECWAMRSLKLHFVRDSNSYMACRHLGSDFSGSFFCVPIMAKGEIMGLFSFQPIEFEDHEEFYESRKHLTTIAVNRIALALSNLELRDKLLQQSVRDPLTSLFNRRYMEETLDREIYFATRNNLKVGVIMMDIDNFKQLNDVYGHRAGDKALQVLGNFLKRNVRKEDVVCRYGGDEFVLVLPKASSEVSDRCVKQMKEKAQQLVVNYKDRQIGPLAISMGTAFFPDNGTKWESVISAADKALYLVKQTSHNQAVTKEEVKT